MKKLYIYGGIGVLSLMIVYFVFEDKIKALLQKAKIGKGSVGGSGLNNNYLDENKTLSIATKSVSIPEVSELQKLLNDEGAKLTVDGFFGAKTEAALINARGLKSITLAAFKKRKIVEYGASTGIGAGVAPIKGLDNVNFSITEHLKEPNYTSEQYSEYEYV